MYEKQNTKSFEEYCPRCEHFDPENGVCKKFRENVREYPGKFVRICNGKYLLLRKREYSITEKVKPEKAQYKSKPVPETEIEDEIANAVDNKASEIKKRPTSMSVIGWLFLISGISTPLLLLPQISEFIPEVQKPQGYLANYILGMVLNIVLGIGILKGYNWARLLYFFGAPVVFVVFCVLYGFQLSNLFIVVVCYAVIVFFLTRPLASAFFTGVIYKTLEESRVEKRGESKVKKTIKRISSVILLCLGSLFVWNASVIWLDIFRRGSFFLFLIYAAIGILLTRLGIGLWEKQKWRIILGIQFTTVGVVDALLILWGIVNKAEFVAFKVSIAISGFALLGVGISLIIKQNKLDKVSI